MSGMAAFVVEKYMRHIQWMCKVLESAFIFTTFTKKTPFKSIRIYHAKKQTLLNPSEFNFLRFFKQLDPLWMKISKKLPRGGKLTPDINANESQHSHHLDRRIPTFPKQSHRLVQSCIAFTSGVWGVERRCREFRIKTQHPWNYEKNDKVRELCKPQPCLSVQSNLARLWKKSMFLVTSRGPIGTLPPRRLGGPQVFAHPTGKFWYVCHDLRGAQFGRPHQNQTKTNHSETQKTRPSSLRVFEPIDSQPPSGSTRYRTTR